RAVALGAGARSTAADALALGAGAQGTAANAVAVGRGATAANARSVALGDGAATDNAVGTTNASLNGITYGNFAGSAPIATVSVGTSGEKRTITNVAAGRISDTSTDAINGSQLYATNAALGNLANTTVNILGGDAELAPNGSLSMSDIGGTGEDTIHDAIEYAAQGWNVSVQGAADANVAPGGSVDFSNSDGNILITRSGTDLEFNLDKDIDLGADGSLTTGETTVDNDGLTVDDGAGNTTQTTTAGTTVTNTAVAATAVVPSSISVADVGGNETTIGGAQVVVGGDNRVTINGDTGTIGGLTNTTWDPDNTLNTRGQAATEDQHKSVSDVANMGWNVTVDGEDASADNKVGPGGVVDFSNTDGNIEITRDGTDLEFNLNKDIDLGSDGSLTAGNAVVNNDGLTVDDGAGNTT